MVEAFFVVNARDAASMSLQVPDSTEREEAVVANLRVSGFAVAESGSTASPTAASPDAAQLASEAGESMRLANFVEANRVLLNILVREKPSLLDSSLAALIKMSRCRAYLDFDNKRTYFQSAMKKLRQTALRSHGGSTSSVRIPVRREHIFEDSYYALRMRSGQELRRKLHISFTGEEGIDAGGVTREWYMILAREIFNPNYVLFTSAADSPTFQPNPLSYVNKDHLSYFEFVGKVIGKAVADGQLLDAHFTRSFYKHILQLPISYHDMEAIDPEYYRNLHSILDNAIEDLGLELTFSAEQSNFGKLEIVDLIPNGRHVNVTDENKMEYVKLVTHHRMATGIRQQIDAFLKGFHQLVPADMISIFNENELELLISGMPEIDIDDLKANTDYANFKPTDAVIRWFWNVLYAFTHEERALFLQFVTGTSKVPLEGFKALEGMRGTQKFNIHKAYGNTSALPSAHTCFNQLDLPEYESEEKLKQRLLFAIREGSEGFGFG
jgi:E3 ubiquitin-protein ligase HUWE1